MVTNENRQVWLPIPAFPQYEVSNDGQVRLFNARRGTTSLITPYTHEQTGSYGVPLHENKNRYDIEVPMLLAYLFFEFDKQEKLDVLIQVQDPTVISAGESLSVKEMNVLTRKNNHPYVKAELRALSKRDERTPGGKNEELLAPFAKTELWAAIPGFNFYKVSSFGRVFSERGAKDKSRYLTPAKARIKGQDVYRVALRDHHGKTHSLYLHDVVAKSFFRLKEAFGRTWEYDIHFKDGDWLNCKLSNLSVFQYTGAKNTEDGKEEVSITPLRFLKDEHGVTAELMNLDKLRAGLKVYSPEQDQVIFSNIMRNSFAQKIVSIEKTSKAGEDNVKQEPAMQASTNTQSQEAKVNVQPFDMFVDSVTNSDKKPSKATAKEPVVTYYETAKEALNNPIVGDFPPKVLFGPALTGKYWRRISANVAVSSRGEVMLRRPGEIHEVLSTLTVSVKIPGVTNDKFMNYSPQRAVATAFLPNPDNLPRVAVKDPVAELKLTNIEWTNSTRRTLPSKDKAAPEQSKEQAAPAQTQSLELPLEEPVKQDVSKFYKGIPYLFLSASDAIASGPDDNPFPIKEELNIEEISKTEIWRRVGYSNLIVSSFGRVIMSAPFANADATFEILGKPMPVITGHVLGARKTYQTAVCIIDAFVASKELTKDVALLKPARGFIVNNLQRQNPVSTKPETTAQEESKDFVKDFVKPLTDGFYNSLPDALQDGPTANIDLSTYPPKEFTFKKNKEVWRVVKEGGMVVSSHGRVNRFKDRHANISDTIDGEQFITFNNRHGDVRVTKLNRLLAECFVPLDSQFKGVTDTDTLQVAKVDRCFDPGVQGLIWQLPEKEPKLLNSTNEKKQESKVKEEKTQSEEPRLSSVPYTKTTLLELLQSIKSSGSVPEDDIYPPKYSAGRDEEVWRRYGASNVIVSSKGEYVYFDFDSRGNIDVLSVKAMGLLQIDKKVETIFFGPDGAPQKTQFILGHELFAACFTPISEEQESASPRFDEMRLVFDSKAKGVGIHCLGWKLFTESDNPSRTLTRVWPSLYKEVAPAQKNESNTAIFMKGKITAFSKEQNVSIDAEDVQKISAFTKVDANLIEMALTLDKPYSIEGWIFSRQG